MIPHPRRRPPESPWGPAAIVAKPRSRCMNKARGSAWIERRSCLAGNGRHRRQDTCTPRHSGSYQARVSATPRGT